MNLSSRLTAIVSAAAACVLCVLPLALAAQGNPEAAKLTNPVKPTPASIADGKKIYDRQCVSCHGAAGKGDGKTAPLLNPKPSDLTSGEWVHGSTDGEIYTLIKDGSKVKGSQMKSFAAKLTADDIWNVVNYVRTLAPPSKTP
jgi:mono/diheme cytochrome c family protein